MYEDAPWIERARTEAREALPRDAQFAELGPIVGMKDRGPIWELTFSYRYKASREIKSLYRGHYFIDWFFDEITISFRQ